MQVASYCCNVRHPTSSRKPPIWMQRCANFDRAGRSFYFPRSRGDAADWHALHHSHGPQPPDRRLLLTGSQQAHPRLFLCISVVRDGKRSTTSVRAHPRHSWLGADWNCRLRQPRRAQVVEWTRCCNLARLSPAFVAQTDTIAHGRISLSSKAGNYDLAEN